MFLLDHQLQNYDSYILFFLYINISQNRQYSVWTAETM